MSVTIVLYFCSVKQKIYNLMKKICTSLFLVAILIALSASSLRAQYLVSSDSVFNAGTPMTGHIWGYTFGDFYDKGHADALNRGNNNQYSGIPQDRTAFQIRRIYFGYDYNFNKKFSSELLLAAEDNFPAGNPPSNAATPAGDQLLDSKLAFYIKLANIRWKNVWKGTDLVVGQQATPAFGGSSEKVWGYRSIERTITDIRRTPSYDLGVGLQGTFDPKTKNYGYNLLIGNGSSAKPEGDDYKMFYGDVWAKFLNQKLIVDLYGDYNRLKWTGALHNSRQMWKLFAGYNTAPLSVGLEGFINNLKQDLTAYKISDGAPVVLDNVASGASVFVNGDIIKNTLRFFARYDYYTPTNKVDNSMYSKYTSGTNGYNDNSYSSAGVLTGPNKEGDMTYRQSFITLGLDYMPTKNVHIMPNIWYSHYATQLSDDLNNTINGDLASKAKGDYDLVYRITFYYTFGK